MIDFTAEENKCCQTRWLILYQEAVRYKNSAIPTLDEFQSILFEFRYKRSKGELFRIEKNGYLMRKIIHEVGRLGYQLHCHFPDMKIYEKSQFSFVFFFYTLFNTMRSDGKHNE